MSPIFLVFPFLSQDSMSLCSAVPQILSTSLPKRDKLILQLRSEPMWWNGLPSGEIPEKEIPWLVAAGLEKKDILETTSCPQQCTFHHNYHTMWYLLDHGLESCFQLVVVRICGIIRAIHTIYWPIKDDFCDKYSFLFPKAILAPYAKSPWTIYMNS